MTLGHLSGSGHRARGAALATLALFGASSGASARASDTSATHAYLQAEYALAKAAVASTAAVQAKVHALNANLAISCPRAAAGSGEDEATQPMAHEVVADLWAISYGANARAIATFVADTRHLRWSNSRITRLAKRYASSLHEMATLPQRDLCPDVRAWAASGFTVIPAGIVALDEHAEGIQLEAVPEHLLAPFESASDRRIATRIATLETKIEQQEFRLGQADWILLLGTLAMNQ